MQSSKRVLLALLFAFFSLRALAAPDIVVKQDWDGAVVANNGSTSFEPIYSGQTNTRRFRIENRGTTTLTISNPGTLIVRPIECITQFDVPAATVVAGGTTYVTFRQQCESSQQSFPVLYWVDVSIASNDPDTSAYKFTLGGQVRPSPAVMKVYRDWDNVVVPNGGSFTFPDIQTYVAQSRVFRITNTGTGDLWLYNTGHMVSGPCFSEIESPAYQLFAGHTTYIRVRFMCASPGTFNGDLTMETSDPVNSTFVIHLQATAWQSPPPEIGVTRDPGPVAQVNGSSFGFPTTGINQSDIRTFHVTNDGNGPLVIMNRQSVVSGACFIQLDDLPGTIAAQSSATFRVRFGCSNPGLYQGAISIQNNDDDEGAYTIGLYGMIVRNNAEFVSQSIPATMTASAAYDVSVTVKNTGGTTWTAAGNYRLGIQPDSASANWPNRIYLGANESVPPGATKTFTVRVTAPATPGTYAMQWRMVEEMVEWFGATTPAATVNVQRNGATFVSQSCPASMTGGVKYDCTVTMRNDGTTTWTAGASYRLGIQPDSASATWGVNRAYLPSTVSVPPGASYTFTAKVTAPMSSGTYPLQWRMVQELVEWFGATTPALNINVAANDATFVSQTVASSMTTGQSYPVSIRMHNSGATTWTAAGGYKLMPVVANNPWGPRIALPSGLSVAPGADATFSFNVTAPATAGNYPFQWQMVQEPSASFGQKTTSKTIAVSPPPAPVISGVTPTDIPVGTIGTVTLIGSNLSGATVTIGRPADGRVPPIVQNVSVNAAGTQITLQVDARDSAVDGFYGVLVETAAGRDGAMLRILPDRPVIDAYTPSQGSWGDMYYVALFGANLDGATVDAISPDVQLFDVETTEGAITGLLYVTPGSGTVNTNLRIRRGRGEAFVPLELRDRETLTKTSRLTPSSAGGTDGVFIQDPVQLLPSAPNTKFGLTCHFHSERSRGHSSITVLIRNPITHKPDPRILDGLQYGESRFFESLIAKHTGAMSLSMDLVCDPDSPDGWDVYFCAELFFSYEVVGVGGQAIDASACTGSSSTVSLTGSGFVNFAYVWGDPSTGATCSTIQDISPDPVRGNRQGKVTLNSCCTDPLSIDTEFTLDSDPGFLEQIHTHVADVKPAPSCAAPGCQHNVAIRAFIPFEAVHSPSEGCLQFHRGIWFHGDDRDFEAWPGPERSRMEQTFCAETGGPAAHCGESRKYAQDGILTVDESGFHDHITAEALADTHAENDCTLLHFRGRTTPDSSLVRINSGDPRIYTWRSVAAGAIPDDDLAPDIDWDLTVSLDTSVNPPRAHVTGQHDGFPSYEVYVDGQRVYGYDAKPHPDPNSLFPPMDRDVDCTVIVGQLPCTAHN